MAYISQILLLCVFPVPLAVGKIFSLRKYAIHKRWFKNNQKTGCYMIYGKR